MGRRVTIGLMVAAVVGALALAGTSWRWSTDTSASRDAYAKEQRTRQRLTAAVREARADRRAVDDAVSGARDMFVAVGAALDSAADAHNHVVSVHNSGAELFNAGRLAESAEIYDGEGTSAVAEEVAKAATVRDALSRLQEAIAELEERTR